MKTIVIGKFKVETPKNVLLDESFCLRSKAFSFRWGSDNIVKLRDISKSHSKKVIFEECYSYQFGAECQKGCDNYIIRSIIHEMFLLS